MTLTLPWLGKQQASLFGVPKIIPVCHYCKQPRSKVVRDREVLAVQYPHHYPQGPVDDCVCCAPDSEHRCPECNSTEVSFSDFDNGIDSDTGYHDAGEMFACRECGAKGYAEDAQPARQPWAELEAVAACAEIPRLAPVSTPAYREVA